MTHDQQPSSRHDEDSRKDYLRIAQEYVTTAPFRDTGGKQICVTCQHQKASGVFFPCEHKSVCAKCIETEGFCQPAGDRGSLCPVCCQQISFVVPYKDGTEADKYWRWVEEVKPPLPSGFRQKFHEAAILLTIKSEPDSHKTWDRPDACCVVS